MRKAQDLIGLLVIELEGGGHVGEVRDVLFTTQGEFHSLLLEKAGLLSPSRVVHRASVHAVGRDAITIRHRLDAVQFRDDTGLIRSLMDGDIHFVGKDVLTQTGNLLGTVEDVYIDEDLRKIVGYELSEGLLVDLKEGRKVLLAHPEMMVGADALLVPEEAELGQDLV
jgi:uncharacterized protein YrrD